MTSYVPIVKNNANGAVFYVALAPTAATGQYQSNPTLAAGDAKISLDGGAFANLNTLPAVTPGSSKAVKVTLSQAETNADNIAILFSDAAGAEWCDLLVNIQTTAKQFDDLAIQSDLTSVKNKTDSLTFTVAGMVDSNVVDWKGATAPAMTGDAFARIGAAGAGLTALGDTRIAHLDADISTRSSHTAADIWAVATRLLTAGTNIVLAKGTGITGLNDLDASGVRGAVGLGSASLDTQLALIDADVLTRSTYAGTDTAGTTTLLGRLTSTRAGYLDNLSAGAVATAASITALPQAVWDALTSALTTVGSIGKLLVTNIDATISSRLAGSSYTAPDNADIAAIKAKTDNLPADPADASDIAGAFTSLQTHGDSTWATATGFATSSALATTDGKVDAIKAVTDALPDAGALTSIAQAGTLGTPAGASIAADIAAVPTASENADAVLAATYEGSETVQSHLRLTRAALLGKANGLATTTAHYRDAADTKNRITATVDADGNRSAITTDAT